MRITSVAAFHIAIPFPAPYTVSFGTVEAANVLVVKLTTDEGIVGWGEADPLPPFTAETIDTIWGVSKGNLANLALGSDPCNPNALMKRFDAVVSGNRTAKGAFEIACYDIIGKAAGLPLHTIFGGALHDSFPVLWPLGSGSSEKCLATIEAKRAEGYHTFMLKAGAVSVEEDIARVRAIVAALPPSAVHISVDANAGWDARQALRFVEGTRGVPLCMLEQPLPAHDTRRMAELRMRSSAPLSADEGVVSTDGALRLVQERCCDIFSLKITKHGGFAAARGIAAIAAASGVSVLVNSMLECGIAQAASLQLAATLRNPVEWGHCFMSTLRMSDDITTFSSLVEAGRVRVPDGPGLGITVDEEKVQRYTVAQFCVSSESGTAQPECKSN